MNFYRHWHGPMYYLWLAALPSGPDVERRTRTLGLIFPILTIVIIYAGTTWLLGGQRGWLAGAAAAAMYAWGLVSSGVTELAPHPLFVLLSVVSLMLLAKALVVGGSNTASSRKYWYAAVAAAGLSMATLEVGVVLALTLALTAYRQRFAWRVDGGFIGKSTLLLAGVLIAAWPGAAYRLAFLKAYLFMAYLAVFRSAAWGGTFLEAWTARLALAPVEFLLIAAALILYWRRPSERSAVATPFLLYGALMVLFLFRVNGPGPRYLLLFLPPLAIFAAVTLTRFWSEARPWYFGAGLTLAAGLMLFHSVQDAMQRESSDNPRPAALLAAIRERNLQSARLLVPQNDVPELHYYFPHASLTAYEENLGPPIADVDAVVYPQYPVRVEPRGN